MKKYAVSLALSIVAIPATAITITDTPNLPAADRALVNALEEEFFDAMERDGVEIAISSLFKKLGGADRIDDTGLRDMRTIDEKCGKLTSVERYDSKSFGSRVVRDHFVAVHGTCLIRWDLTYAKTNRYWTFDRFNFHTLQGANWER